MADLGKEFESEQDLGAAFEGEADLGAPVENSLRAPGAQMEQPGRLEALARGAGQGLTFGFQDEGSGLIDAVGGLLQGEDLDSFGKNYRAGRDEARANNDAAQKAHGGYYLGGQIGGGVVSGLATLPATAGMFGAGAAGATALQLIGRGAAAGALTGAATGAAAGVGGSNADLTLGDGEEWKQAAKDAAVGGAVGGTVGLVAGGAGGGATAAGRGIANRAARSSANAVGRSADGNLWKGARHIFGGGDKHASSEFVEQAINQEARAAGILVPGADRSSMAKAAEALATQRGQAVDALVSQLDGAAGRPVVDVLPIAQRMLQQARDIPAALPEGQAARGVITDFVDEMRKMAPTGRLTFRDAWEFRRRIDKMLKFGSSSFPQDIRQSLRRTVEDSIEGTANNINGQLGSAYKAAKEAYAKGVWLEEATSKSLVGEGLERAGGDLGLAGMAREAAFSPKAAMAHAADRVMGTSKPGTANFLQKLATGTQSRTAGFASNTLGEAPESIARVGIMENREQTSEAPEKAVRRRALRTLQEAPESLGRFAPEVEAAIESGDEGQMSRLLMTAGNDGSSEGRRLYKLLTASEK